MLRKIKEYIIYRKKKRAIQKELINIATTTLPVLKEFTERKAETAKFFFRILDSTKTVDEDQLVLEVMKLLADKLAIEQSRLLEIIQYMASLSPDEIQKILVHSMIETMPKEETK